MKKLNVVLLFGGVSSEHEISCKSAKTIADHLDPHRYEIYKVGITRAGHWLYYPGPTHLMVDDTWHRQPDCVPCLISPDRTCGGLMLLDDARTTLPIDVAIPVLHGKNGEDGTMQGLLELAGIAYVGCGVMASAACMDKAIANTLMDAAGIPRCAWSWANRSRCADFASLEQSLAQKLGYPIFVKPANAGSSVGISKAENAQELQQAIQTALKEDDKVVFEEFVQGQEIECAVLGNDQAHSTLPGEILASESFYTYEDKYVLGNSSTLIPARLEPQKLEQVRQLAEKAYLALGCTGLSRVDFFVRQKDGAVLLNEINTFPGFTSISMYPQLMEADGLPLPRLLDELIALALERREERHG